MKGIYKRILTGCLAVLMIVLQVISHIPYTSFAAETKFNGPNIWKGSGITILGHKRNYLFKWKASDGNYTFCIEEGQHMGKDVRALAGTYSITDADIPFISDKEMFTNLSLVGSWTKSRGNGLSDADYAAAQMAVWAIMRGDIDMTTSLSSQIDANISGNVVTSAGKLLQYIKDVRDMSALGNGIYLSESEAMENPINMEEVDGRYEARVDLSKYPDIKHVVWSTKEGNGFTYQVEGNELVIIYTGSEKPKGVLAAKAPKSLEKLSANTERLMIYNPIKLKDQAMIGGVAELDAKLFMVFGGTSLPTSDTEEVEVYRHSERFESHYQVELVKKDAETNQTLEGAVFEVLERFDASQLGDGEDGSIASSQMSPKPSTWREFHKFAEVTTDADGKARHQDIRYYDYDKIYVGHPQPEYWEVPEANPDGSNADEIAAIEEENERLRQSYEAIVALCEEEGYFHDDDIEVAREQMLADRDATYENFINLNYQYTFREVQARDGYILHGNHNDDIDIEVIQTNSSEAGARTEILLVTPEEIRVLASSFTSTFSDASDKDVKRSLALTMPRFFTSTFSIEKGKQKSEEIVTATSSDASSVDKATGSNAFVSDENFLNDGDILDDIIYLSTNSDATKGIEEREIPASTSLLRFFARGEDTFDTEEETDSVFIELPEPVEDDVDPISKGDTTKVSHQFEVFNHRTEGEIHINKRDMELFMKDNEDSYGKSQGDATLEGAVYGLYASADIIHPDGKSGVIYQAGDLVAIATTDVHGDASFMAYTEESTVSKSKTNVYDTWIGRPLILGSYFIKEIARSEGYELSISGKNLTESNRKASAETTLLQAGSVSNTALSRRIDEQEGDISDVEISYFKTKDGFSVVISGYPRDTKFYEVKQKEIVEQNEVVKEIRLATKSDALGNVIYKKAKGGELKLGSDGKPQIIIGEEGDTYVSEVHYLYHRLDLYPSGEVAPEDTLSWESSTIDVEYWKEEMQGMLERLGYKPLDTNDGGGSPWVEITLVGTTHAELSESLLTYLQEHSFYDSIGIHSLREEAGAYKAVLFVDYTRTRGNAIYEAKSQTVYIKKNITVDGGAADSHIWIAYPKESYTLKNFEVIVSPKKEITDSIPFLGDVSSFIKDVREAKYVRYQEGETLLDLNGNPISEMEEIKILEQVEEVRTEEELTEITNITYDEANGIYMILIPNTIDWANVSKPQSMVLRLQTPEKTIEVDGVEMAYADYLGKVKGSGISTFANRRNTDEGSFIEYIDLLYPGQIQVYSDGNTRQKARIVLERVIKQAIEVTKDISKESYEKNNTYKIHKDAFTLLFGGYFANPKKYVKGFSFKLYLVSDLEKAGLLREKADGSYDYKALFYDETKTDILQPLAIAWDKESADIDGDKTTLHAGLGNGMQAYYGRSIPLPYGKYVMVEEVPTDLVNKHYEIDDPREVELPLVPEVEADGSIREDIPNSDYIYHKEYTPQELQEKFLIRFNEEDHVIEAHNHDGDFKIYKYGLDKDLVPDPYENAVVGARYRYGVSEDAGTLDEVFYERVYDINNHLVDLGIQKNDVYTMQGKSLAIDGKYAKALVPYSILDPRYGEVINDAGDIGNRDVGTDKDGMFNFIAFAKSHFENTFYSSKLRIEKLDAETGENIIHDDALFKIYAAKRDVNMQGLSVSGTGNVIFETREIRGSRTELEARGDVDDIRWDATEQIYIGSITAPVYDENEQIFLTDTFGNDVGIFKAYSTEQEVLKADGSISKEKVGYIETFQPLGAGVYVLVEVDAPTGYQKSKPIAFEVYKDEVAYYADGESTERTKAERYQYVNPITTAKETQYTDVARIKIKDKPSTLKIHKVEDGDKIIGDRNGLDGLHHVNDTGDTLQYIIRGKKEYLEARGDVSDIRFDHAEKIYYGIVQKGYDDWSENLIEIEEEIALASENMKPLYAIDTGAYSGYSIRYDTYVPHADMTLYEGFVIKKNGFASYEGVSITKEDGKTVRIVADTPAIGTHSQLRSHIRDSKAPYLPIYDIHSYANEKVELYFYDTENLKTEIAENGEIYALDDRGNRLSFVDITSGLAYVKDDYGNLIAYQAKDNQKIIATSPMVQKDTTGDRIYENISYETDENGLVKYYTGGNIVERQETWTTDTSPHTIKRLPFGAYILEESKVPYEAGYIKASDKGFILRESGEVQDIFYENNFTKLNIAKIDITSKKEIKDATMTLYKAIRVEDDSDKGYHLEKGDIYTTWISGYEYDDDGNIKMEDGKPVETTKPHWIDHIPVGDYILEESIVPYKDGYVKSESIDIEVKETGDVQTAYMEDDYTALEIKKYDTKIGAVLDQEHRARLSLYQANVEADGQVVMEKKVDSSGKEVDLPTYAKENLVITWQTDDGESVKATGRVITDEYGQTYTKYDYQKIKISGQSNAYYYITEDGTTRFHYLPVGKYVLVEEETPRGYATANPVLIDIKDIGSKKQVQYYTMGDVPIEVDIYKQNTGKIVKDATLEIYALDEKGNEEEKPIYTFITGSDGIYSEAEKEQGLLPEGYEIGDLKPHRISYMPIGRYVIKEVKTPFGFVKASDVYFEVLDTPNLQHFSMEDEIPKGRLRITKVDGETNMPLHGARFAYKNKDTGERIEELITDEDGRAESKIAVPTGYLGKDGYFKAYTYEVVEVDAPDNYMLQTIPHEFIYAYEGEEIPELSYTYDALNDINQVKISKKDLTTKEELPGARLRVYEKETKKVIEEWISTKEVHYIKGLQPGSYILEETMVPEHGNYAKAENIEFTITKNMTQVPYIEMFDDSSKVEITKVDGRSKLALEGAKLILKDEKGNTLYAWTSTSKAHMITGLKAGIYYISEVEAPSGYQKANDLKIEVKDTLEKQEFLFANYRLTTGGGNGPTPKVYISFKKTEDSGKVLAGAEFTFYKADGSILTKAISDINGIIRIERPENGIYTFMESKAPRGYYRSEKVHTLEVGDDGIKADFTLINIPWREIKLWKKEIKTEKRLAGAKMQIKAPSGEIIEVISDENGEMHFMATEVGAYIIEEVEAPKGYARSAAKYVVSVEEDGNITGDRIIYNQKTKPGKILLSYRNFFYGLPKTGDVWIKNSFWSLLFGMIILLLIAGISYIKLRNSKLKHRYSDFIIILVVILSLSFLLAQDMFITEIFATDYTNNTELKMHAKENILEIEPIEIEIKFEEKFIPKEDTLFLEKEVILQDKESQKGDDLNINQTSLIAKNELKEKILYQGKNYYLENLDIKDSNSMEYIQKEIIFSEVENIEVIPHQIPTQITYKGYEDLESKDIILSLEKKEVLSEYWTEDFSVNISFVDYDADEFMFGNLRIPKENALEILYKEKHAILKALDLDSDCYQIYTIQWDGEAYQKAGIWYRDALVLGSKYRKDIKAIYQVAVPLEKQIIYAKYQKESMVDEEIAHTEEVHNEDEIRENTVQRIIKKILSFLTETAYPAIIIIIVFLVGTLIYLSKKKKI